MVSLLFPRQFPSGVTILVTSVIFAVTGCLTISQPMQAGRLTSVPARTSPVSVIFVEATPDLGHWGKLPEISGYFRKRGIDAFYFDPDVHGDENALASWVCHEKIRRGHRVILVGWSYGLVNSLDALRVLERRNVRVDTLVGIDCFCLNYHRGDQVQPRNADRVVLIYRKRAELPRGFRNPAVCRADIWNHLGMPAHLVTVNTLFRETYSLAQRDASSPTARFAEIPNSSSPQQHSVAASPAFVTEPQHPSGSTDIQTDRGGQTPPAERSGRSEDDLN